MTDRTKAMDDLIAQDADLIDNPLAAAVRELLTDDSMEHLDTFTHNLAQAFDKHGLKAVSADYLDHLNDTARGLRQDIKAEQKHTDNALDNMDAAYRKVERLREELAEAYVKLSGKSVHTSDCATSYAPAMEPGPCNCDAPGDTDLVFKLRDEDSYYRIQEKHWCIDAEELERQRLAAADLIGTQAREIERLREAWKEPKAWLIADEETSWVTLFEPNPKDHPYCDVIPLYSAALGDSHDQ